MRKFKSILLIDDDETSNFISEVIIKKLGITETISTVKNGVEALNFVSNNCTINCAPTCPQIIFLDLHMPVMDGFDFLKELKKQMPLYTQKFKIFVLSSSNNPADITKTKDFDVEGYIVKPLSQEKISMLLEDVA
ncbi:response regulator [Cytophaga hutchinsonii]|jgi:CheY-like chemotaxis protein|uniref:Two-component response regulator n=1 Tax=Cytophaga hutchinsonii (strain ATCC 33406 / DSM 1761 / CIP 103989 / NBRC 15051 / NCIMB 9469 / D465) TaxID=269798 RepID=A0A6N4SMB2_CYTH3|nr:response regulator [Cytophaga hutchinsonii]ABG57397.1 two-component response regulator [Cytophaga hutchinsonii ATCC 33406]SFX97417.1 Response regulator receiver domain-containing protein [Cytophaga hutchinsonii ATCC 33406]